MLDENIKQTLSECFFKTLRKEQVAIILKERWQALPVKDMSDIFEKDYCMMTISSFNFRLLFSLHYHLDEKTRQYFLSVFKDSSEINSEEKLHEYILEYTNMNCGALKRNLSNAFPFLGMSTPEKMQSDCLKHSLGMDYDYHIFVQTPLSESSSLYFGLLFFGDKGLLLEAPKEEEEEFTSEGEIELF